MCAVETRLRNKKRRSHQSDESSVELQPLLCLPRLPQSADSICARPASLRPWEGPSSASSNSSERPHRSCSGQRDTPSIVLVAPARDTSKYSGKRPVFVDSSGLNGYCIVLPSLTIVLIAIDVKLSDCAGVSLSPGPAASQFAITCTRNSRTLTARKSSTAFDSSTLKTTYRGASLPACRSAIGSGTGAPAA